MAAEITLRASLAFRKGSDMDGIDPGEISVTMTGTKAQRGVQLIGTVEEALLLGEPGAGGWLILQNLDPTNYVQVRGASGALPLARLKPGEPALFRLDATSTPYLIANTTACSVRYLLLSD
jgi:hypothetical protein